MKLIIEFLALLITLGTASAQTGLVVSYGSNGVQQLTYAGARLENLSSYPADKFHVGHMKATDLQGNPLTTGGYGWGENAVSRTWNAATQTWDYEFVWGSIRQHIYQQGNTLIMVTTTTNHANSGIIFEGAEIFPLALHFPELPIGFANYSYSQLAFNTTAPSITLADYGIGEVIAVDRDSVKPLYTGFMPTGSAYTYTALVSSTSPDGLATFYPHNDRPVYPGHTDSFMTELRFAPSGTSTYNVVSDIYNSWTSAWPMKLSWQDRRIIGTVYLANSPTGNSLYPGGWPNNPRRYFENSDSTKFDIRTAAGMVLFQQKVLAQAESNVTNLKMLGAQGAITWDIEGEEYPQTTSYVCSPDQIAVVAPEMESVINDGSSAYHGMKLDDAYFKIIRDAGFKVGVCIRPQNFHINADGTAGQTYLADSAIPGELARKIKYAHDRWGATLFYVDSTVEPNGAVLNADMFEQVAAQFPDSLLIPEETTPKHHAYTGAFKTFLFHGDLGTDPMVYNYYHAAFSANLINDVSPSKLAAAEPFLTDSIRHGDILMVHADYWQANNPTVMQMYVNAGKTP